jgi:maltose alpha-D-glucosyltransferase/alpha-amylase
MARRGRIREEVFEHDPQWYKDAVIYELHVRAFFDSDGDGVGDFAGLTQKLDYIQELGVTAIWLLPFYPSPLKDDGYDIAEYVGVHPLYGSMRSFRQALDAAHRRGLRVITELVVNHTSDQHPWFERARQAPPGSRARNFYVWSDTPDRYQGSRIIFQDFEHSNWAWDQVAQSYYWHRFYSHQPDLNYDSPDVQRAVLRVLDQWFDLGVDGMRLDAVPYLFEREGTDCENLPETHEFLRELRRHVDKRFDDRMLLAEANQWPEDATAYFGDGDECHMAFHFPLMPRLFMALRQEDRFPVVDILQQTPETPELCQWALFLRNHDELTLEMVTDEERDYMYRAFAFDPEMRINLGIRRRLAPLLHNHRHKIELMHGLLLSLPGTPVIYYGDEIGMGDNVYLGDRDSVRTPMQWSPDRNAGFSSANPHRLYLPVNIDPEYNYETTNVAAQHQNPDSLLRWMQRLIALRKRYRVFGRGSVQMLFPENHRVLAFLRRHGDQQVLVVANLSRFAQFVELDLSEFEGMQPIELFGQTPFPRIGELPYLLTLGPHAFYWFALETADVPDDGAAAAPPPTISAERAWTSVLRGRARPVLEGTLPRYLRAQRWFASKNRRITTARIVDAVPLPLDDGDDRVMATLVRLEYAEGEPDVYFLPLAFAAGDAAARLVDEHPRMVIARLQRAGAEAGVLYDAHVDARFGRALLLAMLRRRRFSGEAGALTPLTFAPGRAVAASIRNGDGLPAPTISGAEQSNTSVVFGDRLIMKTFRRLEPGPNPELEVGRFLTETVAFEHGAALAGALEYRPGQGEASAIAVAHEFVPSESDAWTYTLGAVSRFYDRVPTSLEDEQAQLVHEHLLGEDRLHPLALVGRPRPEGLDELLGDYLPAAELLGRRLADLHVALAAGDDPAFTPEAITPRYQRSLYQTMRNLARRNLLALRRGLPVLAEENQELAASVLAAESDVLGRFQEVLEVRTGMRTRQHGDLHLGQVLSTGRDFVFIDFEGEPARPFSERRLKRSPLRDVAGLLRSFDYAANFAVHEQETRGAARDDRDARERYAPWGELWVAWISAACLSGYFDRPGVGDLLPATPAEQRISLDAMLLEKACYELGYELSHRPGWARVPLRGILALVGER